MTKDVDADFNPEHHEHELIGIEYAYPHPERYDGISEWHCPTCNKRWGRWSLKELKPGEAEKRFGGEF